MTKWLTTGEMIDKLKFGEVAENLNGVIKAYWQTDISRNTEILKFKVMGDNTTNEYIQIEDQRDKWRILPNYVSFEKAMKALKDGKIVTFTFKNEDDYEETIHLKSDYGAKSSLRRGIEWNDLFNGKWTIEGESNAHS